MNKKTIKAARAKAMMSSPLRCRLKEWFAKKGSCPDPEVKDFYAFTRDSFQVEGYEYHEFTGKIPVAV